MGLHVHSPICPHTGTTLPFNSTVDQSRVPMWQLWWWKDCSLFVFCIVADLFGVTYIVGLLYMMNQQIIACRDSGKIRKSLS
jgi:hypothetical protein